MSQDNGFTIVQYWLLLQDNEEPSIPIILKKKDWIDNEWWVISLMMSNFIHSFTPLCLCFSTQERIATQKHTQKYWGICSLNAQTSPRLTNRPTAEQRLSCPFGTVLLLYRYPDLLHSRIPYAQKSISSPPTLSPPPPFPGSYALY